MRQLVLITTGGTIEKTYDEMTGTLENRVSIVGRMLEGLRLEDTTVSVVDLMSKDSLYITDAEREGIVAAVEAAFTEPETTGVIVLHGTDTLCLTGELVHTRLGRLLRGPVVLTGAMRPFEMVRSDALQNLTEAVFATGVMGAGVYCVAHGRVLPFPGVLKDRARGTFVPG